MSKDINPFEMSETERITFMDQIREDKNFRKSIAIRSHFWFFYIYFYDYILYEPADFHYDLFNITQDEDASLSVITAFRGSGKSTIMSLSFPIWAILGYQKKRYIVLISQTSQQVTQILTNIKTELESNELLISDFGPFSNESISWNQSTITLSGYENARITALSTGSNIRGLRDRQNRPQIIVCDDIESLETVKTMEGRNNTHKWFTHDVLPSGDKGTRTIVIGNLLHEDSLLMRMKEQILNDAAYGIYREYPLLDENDECTWREKYPDTVSIENLKKSVFDNTAWLREYCLKIVSDSGRVIYPSWIQYYEELPQFNGNSYKCSSMGVDLAISEKAYADYTAIVIAHLFEYSRTEFKIYISSYFVNKRLNFVETTETIKETVLLSGIRSSLKIYVESVAYQEAMSQNLRSEGYNVFSVSPKGDKRSRLSSIGPMIQTGRILFSKNLKVLIDQITNFGVEKHDDLADALVYAVTPLIDVAQKPKARGFSEKPRGF